MSDERFKNATKQHLIGEIKELEQKIEMAASDREMMEFYKGQVVVYEAILNLVKEYHTKLIKTQGSVMDDLPF